MSVKYNKQLPSSGRFADYLEIKANEETSNKAFIRHFVKGSYQDISFKQFYSAVNSAAVQLKDGIQKEFLVNEEGFATIGYLSNSSSEYALNSLALISLNLTPIFLSPRNSIDILVHLLNTGEAKTLVYSKEFEELANEIKKHLPAINLIPSIKYEETSYNGSLKAEPLVYMDKYHGNCSEHIMAIIHSSGSTSYPKLIHLSNRYFFVLNKRADHQEPVSINSSVLSYAPLFHMYGFGKLGLALVEGNTLSFPSSSVATAKNLLQDAKKVNAFILVLLPYLVKQLQEFCNEDPSLASWKYLSQLSGITCAGSSLPEAISEDYKNNQVKLTNLYGSTETGAIAYSSTDSSNFQVLRLREELKCKQTIESNNIFRMIIDSSDEGLASGICPPGSDGYPVGDLFKAVSYDSSGQAIEFKIVGRTDDTIIQISGEKTNPVPIEQDISSSPYVEHCLVYGTGKLQCACVIQLNYEISIKTPILTLYEEVFKAVEKANKSSPAHSRILPELVLILALKSSKVFPVTPKGNVIRKKAAILFQEEIDNLYQKLSSYSDSNLSEEGEISLERIELNIKSLFEKVTSKQLNGKLSFFNQGLDSLTSVKLRNSLNVKYPGAKLTINSIYENDNLSSLSNHIISVLSNSVEAKTIESHIKDVGELIAEYSNFDRLTMPSKFIKPLVKGDKLNVLITGANGSLGQFIIKSLLHRPSIGKIYGLARAQTHDEAMKRIQEGFSERKIELTESQWSQIIPLPYKSDEFQLGLDDETYTTVVNSVDIIYHVAWRMDFLKGVFAFRDNIESTVNLLRISAFSPRKPVFGFVSTVGATLPILDSASIKECQLHTSLKNLASCNGYNLSKLVSENLIYKWHEKYNIPTDIFRVGQVSGDTVNGVWNLKEHIPLLVKGIQTMKVAPSTFGEQTAWIPVDVAANGITDITYNPSNEHTITISHIVNPNQTSWSDILQSLKQCGIEFEVIDSNEFIEVLNTPKYQNVDLNPLASLTDFFTNALTAKKFEFKMETVTTQKLSPSIASCKPTNADIFNKFINYWTQVGFMKC